MEDFLTIPLLMKERAALAAAAKAKRVSIEAYVLSSALDAAQAAQERVLTPEARAAQQAIIAAYTVALGYTPDRSQMARVAKVAKDLAKAGRDPAELGLVVAWVRTNDGRYRSGQHIPLEIVATAWPAWEARQRTDVRPAATSIQRINTPSPRTVVEEDGEITF